jgi:hypothetical protein
MVNQAHCKFQLSNYSIGTASSQVTVPPPEHVRVHRFTSPELPHPAVPEHLERSEHSRLPPVRLDGRIAIIEMTKIAIHNGITHAFSFDLIIHLLFYMSNFITKALSRLPLRMFLQLSKKYTYHMQTRMSRKLGIFFDFSISSL